MPGPSWSKGSARDACLPITDLQQSQGVKRKLCSSSHLQEADELAKDAELAEVCSSGDEACLRDEDFSRYLACWHISGFKGVQLTFTLMVLMIQRRPDQS